MANQTYTLKYGGKDINVNRSMNDGYLADYEAYRQLRESDLQKQKDQLANQLATDEKTVNTNYDDSAKQAYVDYMRKQKALPSQLQALGVRGGATESALLNLYNNYGTTHGDNEASRNTALGGLRQTYENDLFNAQQTYDSELANAFATALNNQRQADVDNLNMFAASIAQYPTTASGYDKYNQWLNNMANSNDPLKEYKIAMIRQQMAKQFPNGKPSSKSSSSGGGSSYSGSYSRTSSATPAKTTTVRKTTTTTPTTLTRRQISQQNDLKAARNTLW